MNKTVSGLLKAAPLIWGILAICIDLRAEVRRNLSIEAAGTEDSRTIQSPLITALEKEVQMRRDGRSTYSLAVNDSLEPVRDIENADAWLKRSALWRMDPLNPRCFPSYPRPLSVVELPDAPVQRWLVPEAGVQRGEVRDCLTTNSRIRGEALNSAACRGIILIRSGIHGYVVLLRYVQYRFHIPSLSFFTFPVHPKKRKAGQQQNARIFFNGLGPGPRQFRYVAPGPAIPLSLAPVHVHEYG